VKHRNLSIREWQDEYYDGTDECINYEFLDSWDTCESLHRDFMRDTYDDEILWLMRNGQSKYYREPFDPKLNKLVLV
jgi:hypothetical protein